MFKPSKILLILSIVCFSFVSHAQGSQKGKIKVSLSGIPVVHWDFGYYGFVVKPGFEYFVTEHFSVQNDFFYHNQSGYKLYGVQSISNTFGFIPSLRYNYSLKDNKLLIFAQVGVGFGAVLYKPMDDNNVSPDVGRLNSGIVIYNAGIGVGYRFSNLFEMELALPYILVKNITNSSNSNILFDGIGPTIGIKFTLNNK